MGLRRRRVNDETRDDVAKTMVSTARSRAVRSDVEGRPEKLRAPARCGDDRVVVRLHEKKDKRYKRVRTDERMRGDQKSAALAHRVVAGVLKTVAARTNSGEQIRRS